MNVGWYDRKFIDYMLYVSSNKQSNDLENPY